MRKLVLTAALLFGTLTSEGVYVGHYDGKTWYYSFVNKTKNTISLNNNGENPAILPCPTGEFALQEKIGTYTIVQIGQYAFTDCTGLTKITLPPTVSSICHHAFAGCTSLKELTIPTTVTELGGVLFSDCGTPFALHFSSWDHWQSVKYNNTYGGILTAPSDITLYVAGKPFTRLEDLPDSVRNIPKTVFCRYDKLTIGEIPSAVTNIGTLAFSYCPNVRRVEISRGNLQLGERVFAFSGLQELRYSGDARNIPTYAFYSCTSLTNVTIASAVTNIANSAFLDCSALESINLPSSVETIGMDAFMNCTKLGAIEIPAKVKAIPRRAFHRNRGLQTITLPEGLESIGDEAFYSCDNVSHVAIPSSVTSIGDGAFAFCSELVDIELPPGLKTVPNKAFLRNYDLKKVSLPDGLTMIGSEAFYYCSRLSSIDIPSSVTSIGESAFALTSLKEVTVPSNVVSVGINAFGSKYLKTVYVSGKMPNGTNAFKSCPSDLVTYLEPYDASWDPALEQGTWCERKIVCSNDWTVTFDLGDKGERTGGGALVQTVHTGGAATAPTVVSTNEDYVFSGWDKSFDDIPFRRTINAVYEPKPIAVKGASEFTVRRFDDGASVALAAFGGVKPYVWSAVSGLPTGMRISKDGILSGNTAFLGTATVTVQVADSRNVRETFVYTLTVEENPDLKPVLDARSPDAEPVIVAQGRERIFSVTAHDPEGGRLGYRWFVDGVEQSRATNSIFAFLDPDDGATNREIRCVIEDPVWKLGYTIETTWAVRTLLTPEIVSDGGDFFASGSGLVSVTCNVAEAELFLAVGFAPRLVDQFRYTAPVTLDRSATVWAIARFGDQITSYASRDFTVATPTLSDPVGAGPYVRFTTGGDAEWTSDGASLRSGAVGPEEESWLEATFDGAGTFRFRWKTDCEHDTDDACSWDALEVRIDGSDERFAVIDGTDDWSDIAIDFTRSGRHTLLWRFSRDDYDEPDASYENCGWISDVRRR